MEINKDKLKEFLLFIREKTKITSLELIEKDFYLNVLLSKLNMEEYAFKGGTCLAKIYLDYFRFSEDLDFTFKNQKLLEKKSTNQIKKICKEKIDEFGKQLENVGMDFILEKSNRKYVEIGNNNKLASFKVWYDSLFANKSSFVKIQINFLERIYFDIGGKEIMPLLRENLTDNEKIYFQEFINFYEKKKLFVYDIREIAAEKIRSLLTRKTIKSRDAVDLLFIYQIFQIGPRDLIKEAEEKIIFAIGNYEKYKNNFILSKEKLDKMNFSYNEVRYITIKDFRKEDFEKFVNESKPILEEVVSKVTRRIGKDN